MVDSLLPGDKYINGIITFHALCICVLGGWLLSYNGEHLRGNLNDPETSSEKSLHAAEFGVGLTLVMAGLLTSVVLFTTCCDRCQHKDRTQPQNQNRERSPLWLFFIQLDELKWVIPTIQIIYIFSTGALLVVSGMLFLAKIDQKVKKMSEEQKEYRTMTLEACGYSSFVLVGVSFIVFILSFLKLLAKQDAMEDLRAKYRDGQDLRANGYTYIQRS